MRPFRPFVFGSQGGPAGYPIKWAEPALLSLCFFS